MFVLDTDHIGILQRKRGAEFQTLVERIEAVGETNVYVSIISFHEQIAGWTKYIKGSQDQSKTVMGYLRLEKILQDFAEAQVLPYSPAAAEVFTDIRDQKVRIATMDLRIASIAIAHQMTLATRNAVDFEKIPNLDCVDWTV